MQVHQVAAISKGKIKTTVTSSYCQKCILGDFYEFSTVILMKDSCRQNRSRGLNKHAVQRDNENDDLLSKEIRKKANEAENDQEKSYDLEAKESDWVAVIYDHDWHIGKIKSVDDEDDIEITFLRRANASKMTQILFKWPYPEDVLFVKRSDIIFKLSSEPNHVGRSFKINDTDIKSIITLFCVK